MNSKKIVITSLVGSIGIAVLGLSLSFAWYNTSENLYIDTLVISVSGEQQLLISTSGEDGTFTDNLKYRLDDDDNTLPDAGVFQPVSSMFKSKWLEDDLKTEPEMYFYSNFSVNGDYAPEEDIARWGYYSQHLYLYSNANIFATIDPEDFVAQEIEARNKIYAKTLMNEKNTMDTYHEDHPDFSDEDIYNDIVNNLNSLKKCLRIGLYDVLENKFHIIDPYKDGDTLLGGRADLFANRYYDSYTNIDNYESYEIIYGEVSNRGNAVYLDARDTDTDKPAKYTSFDSRTKAGVHAFDLDKSLANGLEIKEEGALALDDIEENILLDLHGGVPKEIVLMVYMEGWDKDCTNVHMGGAFDIGIKFKVSQEIQL